MADVRKSQVLRQYLEEIWHENNVSATVRLPQEIERLLYQIIKDL
jgi:hypothetical protein